MPHGEKSTSDSAIFDALSETFELRPPIYEFGFCIADHRSKGSEENHETRATTRGNTQNIQMPTSDPSSNMSFDAKGKLVIAHDERLDDLTSLPFADCSAQTIICHNALEHVFEPRRAMAEMYRILKPSGVVFACVPGNRPSLGGNHFWHFTPQAMQQLMQSFQAGLIGWQGTDQQPHTVFAVGCKGPVDAAFIRGLTRFPQRCQERLALSARQIGWIQKLKQTMVAWAFNPNEKRRFAEYSCAQFAIHMPVSDISKHQLLESCLGEITSGSRLDVQR